MKIVIKSMDKRDFVEVLINSSGCSNYFDLGREQFIGAIAASWEEILGKKVNVELDGDFDSVIYTLCTHCEHFVDENFDAIDYPAEGYAKYIHLEDGEQEFDHDAEPGENHTGAEWEKLRPDLFKEYDDGKIGPNSKHHSRRGKVD